MTDDFDQDPEESPEFVPAEESEDEEEFDPFSDPDYHAPNRCDNPNCLHPNCNDSDDGGAGSERFPGEDIWWKTNDKWKKQQ